MRHAARRKRGLAGRGAVKSKALTGRVKSGALTPPGGIRRRARAALPKIPRLLRREIAARARRIAAQWEAEWSRPLDAHQLGTLIAAVAAEARREYDGDLLSWADRGTGAYEACYYILKKRQHDLPDQVVLALAAWALVGIAGGAA